MKKIIQITLILFTIVYSDRANKNNLKQNEAISNWSYIGPINSDDHYKEILKLVLDEGLSNDSVFTYKENKYKIKDASTSAGWNAVHQLYQNLKNLASHN